MSMSDYDSFNAEPRGPIAAPSLSSGYRHNLIYETLDSGKREEFETGSVRDTQEGKGRFDLVPTKPLRRLAGLYERGAAKYGDRNWEKGQPSSRYYSSCMRHLISYMEGDRTEDHLAAISWNAFAMIWNEEEMPELNDIDVYNATKKSRGT